MFALMMRRRSFRPLGLGDGGGSFGLRSCRTRRFGRLGRAKGRRLTLKENTWLGLGRADGVHVAFGGQSGPRTLETGQGTFRARRSVLGLLLGPLHFFDGPARFYEDCRGGTEVGVAGGYG